MTLDEEITAVEGVIQAARSAATEHLERAQKDLHLEGSLLGRYQDFLSATVVDATATLARCREVASAPIAAPEASARIVQALLAGVRESIRLLYVAMTIVEELAGSAPRNGRAKAFAAPRVCSFCGKSEAETKLAAGPAGNICAPCTRLACGVLGIVPSD
jgi:hypothetical protein